MTTYIENKSVFVCFIIVKNTIKPMVSTLNVGYPMPYPNM